VKRPWTTWLAWGLWGLMLAVSTTAWVARTAWHAVPNDTSTSGTIAFTAAMIAFGTVGVLVVMHVPANPLGWMFLAIALLVGGLIGLTGQYAYQGLVQEPGSLPGALFAAWVYRWLWFPAVAVVFLVPMLFPTGRAPGRRWGVALNGLIGMVTVLTIVIMFYPGPLDDGTPPLPDNPVGIGALELVPGGDAIIGIAFFLLVASAALSMIVRFRRSRGDERQQMKWMTFAAVFIAAGVIVPDIVGTKDTGDVFFAISISMLPIALGIAMLKYRLYDIDRLINRTLVYAALTIVLGAAYVGLVLGGQALFSSFAGGSNLAIAASTLVVAALFLPVRSRVQAFVDRRFYRRRYDAERTLEGFGARLREQIELETLSTDLALVVHETIQPSHVSLWLRSGR
jgi:hypothetical protein